jgi:hypothetical protein
MHRLRLVVLSATLVCLAAPAKAMTVAIVRPPSPSAEMTQAVVRVHGELLSVGLEVEIADGPVARELGTSASRAWLAELATKLGASAIIDIVGNAAAVDVWIVDPASRRFEITRVAVEPNTSNSAEQLAIRAIEVLRSSFLELDLAARARYRETEKEPHAATVVAVREPARQPEGFGFALGAAALRSLDGVGTALMPLLRLDWAARPWLMVQATLAGFGSRPAVAAAAGNALVAQQYGVLGGCYRFGLDRGVRPFVALSAGALRTSVAGQADLPKRGHSVDQWSFLLDGSVGAEIRLGGRYHLSLAGHVHVAEPYVAIHFEDTEDKVVATSGYPNLVMTLTIGAWL